MVAAGAAEGEGRVAAAVEKEQGSNSFHMVVARYVLGQLRTVDRLREMVRLAEGLDARRGLTLEVRQRALDCLARFGQRLRDIPPQRVRAIATNTVRQLAQPDVFLMPAEVALGPRFKATWDAKGADFAMMRGTFYCARLDAPLIRRRRMISSPQMGMPR